MANNKEKPYESKAKITKITATSRGAVKIRDNYFTVEYAEERTFPDVLLPNGGIDMDKERQILWDEVNSVVDDQIRDIVNTYKK